MRKLLGLALVFIILFAATAIGLYVREELRTAYPYTATNVVFEIPKGLRYRDVVGLLEDKKVVHNRYIALAYILYSGYRNKLQAGEYQFDQPMTAAEVIGKIVNGSVYLHKFTVPEGLGLEETAAKWEQQGFGSADSFRNAANSSVGLIKEFDPTATTLEGYLYPETYSFPAHTTARQAIEAMVRRFRIVVERLNKEVPKEEWALSVRDTVILASLVESEAAVADERPIVASVYLNRYKRKMLLQCDPTVIYALEKADLYNGNLTLKDLKFNSPYNTYVNPGFPPGPIMNPGYPSLRAAIQPASNGFLYFVRTTDGRHTFSENLAAHNRAVAAYRALQRRGK